jgi:hypothetical protein
MKACPFSAWSGEKEDQENKEILNYLGEGNQHGPPFLTLFKSYSNNLPLDLNPIKSQ